MHKNAMKCNETPNKWCKNKHGASKIMDTLETYHLPAMAPEKSLMSMNASILVDSIGPPSAEVCRTTTSFP
jgi:hypothetical protein